MAELIIPATHSTLSDPNEIRGFMNERGIWFDQWLLDIQLKDEMDQEDVLQAYSAHLKPFMKQHNYQTADVIMVDERTPNLPQLRAKFNTEHTHTEDEVRFFIDGEGHFWFHLENDEVFCLICQKGDLISVPAGTKHWFTMGEPANVKAIRIFIDKEGWVPHYTHSGVESAYLTNQEEA